MDEEGNRIIKKVKTIGKDEEGYDQIEETDEHGNTIIKKVKIIGTEGEYDEIEEIDQRIFEESLPF